MSDLWYTPRLTIPSKTDLNWINYHYGGYNYCMAITDGWQYSTGSTLPNCTGYAWGRWREILGYRHNLYTGNGGTWYGHTSDGYQRSTTTPKLGCVACWGGSGVDGHVAIVEEMTLDSRGIVQSCLVGESAWQSTNTFRIRTIRRSNNWWIYNNVGTFQGFIYLPVDFLPGPVIFNGGKKMKVRIG